MADAWRRYWFEHEVLRARLVMWRVLFFGLLAADCWLVLIEHAPRYGAGGFNVSQVPALDPYLPVPTPEVVGPLYLLGGFLSAAIALGIRPRRCLALLAPVYGGVYFWSQSDSYQHHYLIALLLVLLVAVPESTWTLPRPGEPVRVRSWAVRLVYVQLGLMYAWTGVTKHTSVWLDGTALAQIVTCEPREHLQWLSGITGWSLEGTLATASTAVMVGEYLAGLIYFVRPLWVVGMALIPSFHLGVEWLGLDIELFSYYMIGTNLVLLAPDRLIARVASGLARVAGPMVGVHAAFVAPRPTAPGLAALFGGSAVLLSGAVAFGTPYVGAGTAALLVGGAAILILWPDTPEALGAIRFRAAGLCLAAVGLGVGAHATDAAYTYYRQWAGFHRRQGDETEAMRLYALANDAAGQAPARHLALARLHVRRGEAALAAPLLSEDFRRQTLRLEGPAARPTTAEDWLARGKTARALAESLALAAEVWPTVGRAPEVEALRARRAEALRTAREAFLENAALDPVCGGGRTELARLDGVTGSDGGGDP
jgi:hypothetical protein